MTLSVDLNSDLGEGFGPYRLGDDSAMLAVVTSANVACGFHGGDPEIMATTFRNAAERGVAVGAHPGFPDRQGLGRRPMPFTAGEIERIVAYQIGAAQALSLYGGHRITYVKPHGALANVAETERSIADAIARAVRAVDSELAFLAIALSQHVVAAEAAGLRVVTEVFADRGYTEHGRLIPRCQPGALIDAPQAAAERCLRMLDGGAIITAGGARLPTPIGSICVHSDSPRAAETARRVRVHLEAAGVELAPFAPP
jgi:UPF0271 protein